MSASVLSSHWNRDGPMYSLTTNRAPRRVTTHLVEQSLQRIDVVEHLRAMATS